MTTTSTDPGLKGIVAAHTHLSGVDGQKGEFVLRGYPIEEIADKLVFEEMLHLLWHGHLPKAQQLHNLKWDLSPHRTLPAPTLALLERAAAAPTQPIDALTMAVASLRLQQVSPDPDADALRLVAALPTLIATYWRLLQKQDPVAPHPELDHVANYLYMLFGVAPRPQQIRALETYLNTVVDHGLNASTFAARVITSTRSDLISAIAGALGALKGPLHGGAPGPALDMVFDIGSADKVEPYLRAKLERGERLMGFGHAIYKTKDPRAHLLALEAERLYQDGDTALYDLAVAVEEKAIALLAEYKPGRNLKTNVEFYTALLLHGLGFETALFTPTFAIGRLVGWIAHCFEQRALDRLIRPQSIYIGDRTRQWIPLADRT